MRFFYGYTGRFFSRRADAFGRDAPAGELRGPFSIRYNGTYNKSEGIITLPLILTKMYIPKMPGKHVRREALCNRMPAGYRGGNQLTLVCAPAGYGKTSAVVEFLSALEAKPAWIALDDWDNDVKRFFAYMLAAFRGANVRIGNDADALVCDVGLDSSDTILSILINSVAASEDRLVLALDDFHNIRSNKVNEAIRFLLERQPPNLHIVVISRENPQS